MSFRIIDKQAHFTGFNPRVLLKSLRFLPDFIKDARQYQRMNPPPALKIRTKNLFPILVDRSDSAGLAEGHYFHQDLWAARKIFQNRPSEHIDIGSRVDGFVAHLLSFMPVTVVDIRPMSSGIRGLTFLQDDATELKSIDSGSIPSLSSLHVAEHFGLGRYSDPVDPLACFKFMATLQRVLSPAGRLYFSVPVGRERVEFNAHRVFSPKTILDSFPNLQLLSFSFVGDDGHLYEDRSPIDMPVSELACGLFEFTKGEDSR